MSLTMANKITIFRILTVPLFVLLIIYYNMSIRNAAAQPLFRCGASMLFLLAVVSDAIDGYVARTHNQITHLGTILDPLADKSLLVTGLILLGCSGHTSFSPCMPVWFVILAISRDCVLLAGTFLIYYLAGYVNVQPRIWGKITTFLQMAIISWVLLGLPHRFFDVAIWCTAASTLFSGMQYIFDGIRQLDKT